MSPEQPPQRTPTQVLKDEHDVIQNVLTSLERMLTGLEEGKQPDRSLFEKAVRFIQEFADRWHHEKEEKHLFPAMEMAGIPNEGGPIAVMLEEHEQGRAYVREIKRAVEGLDSLPDAKRPILDNGWAFIQLLRAHIHKENEILFPMADRAIPPDRMHDVSDAFNAAEKALGDGSPEFYRGLAEEIEDGAGRA